jgi:type IV pilus assembly protein PilV
MQHDEGVTMMSNAVQRHRGANAGFTLLEVLVAVLVLSIGLLGIAGLQVTGLRFNHSAYMRTQATLLAYEMADRMRANRPTMLPPANSYDIPNAAVGAGVPACETVAGCAAAQMAQNDVFQWQRRLAQVLPNGQGVVCLDNIPVEANSTPAAPSCNAAGTTYAIKIWWDDNRDGAPNQRFVVTLNN